MLPIALVFIDDRRGRGVGAVIAPNANGAAHDLQRQKNPGGYAWHSRGAERLGFATIRRVSLSSRHS